MYLQFFGLTEKPFSITPDPRYLYMSERHADALAHLLYGISESGGFIQLTGEVGTGKTTLVRSLLEQLPDHADVALILNPQVSAAEFLQSINAELGVPAPAEADSPRALVEALNGYLLRAHAAGRRTVLIVDEAQNLDAAVLEQVRLLTNLETTRQKLLQIILIGQPELRELLSRNDLRQLAQRVTGRYHLEPLSREDTERYLDHRLRVAGATANLFGPGALREIYRLSHGVPRLINVISDRALLGAYTREQPRVDRALVRRAAAEVFGSRLSPYGQPWIIGTLATAGALLLSVGLWRAWLEIAPPAAPAAQPAVVHAAVRAPTLPAPVAPPGVDIVPLHQLLDMRLETGTDGAFDTLFGLWQQPFRRGDGLACEQAREHGLACLFQRGSLSHLLKLDHPAILNLTDEEGGQHQLVLAAVLDDAAQLAVGEERFWVSVPELSEYWFGDYLVLWQPETADGRALSQGMSDDAVLWLRRTLATLTGEPLPPENSRTFDVALEERVREYQRARRLTVDGLVGPRTMIIMQAEMGELEAPRLAAGGGG